MQSPNHPIDQSPTDAVSLTVHGMTCGGCENAVKRVLAMVDGVTEVSASHREKRVSVAFDPSKTDKSALTRAIESAGYKVVA